MSNVRSHIIAEFIGDEAGETLIVFGGLHGNEAAGVAALDRIAASMNAAAPKIFGRVYLIAGNTRALVEGVRFLDRDLNRHWTPENIVRNQAATTSEPCFSEDIEQRELMAILRNIISTARNEVYAIDLHSTSADGVPFATVGDTMRNRRFAQKFPITILLGIEEQLEGTLLEYLNNIGVVTLGFEGGQHFAENTVDTHEALVRLALHETGIVRETDDKAVKNYAQHLRNVTQCRRIVEVRHRHAIGPGNGFVMRPGYKNFDPLVRSEHLADDASGAIHAKEGGMILMPLYQTLGEDGFFIGREVAPFWIWLSGVLRRMRVGELMHVLPGVRRSEQDPHVLEIDTVIARFFPLQIFHLLGFRKRRWVKNKLVVSRRRFDTAGPFNRQM